MRLGVHGGWSCVVPFIAALMVEGTVLAQAPAAVPGVIQPAREGAERGRQALPAAVSASAEPEMQLGDAIRAALENNRNVGIARRRIGIAENRVSEAKSGDWPSLTFDGATAQRDNQPIVVFGRLLVPQGDMYTAVTRTALVLPLTDFGRTANRKESAQVGCCTSCTRTVGS